MLAPRDRGPSPPLFSGEYTVRDPQPSPGISDKRPAGFQNDHTDSAGAFKTSLIVAIRGWTTTGDFLLFGKPGSELSPEFEATLAMALPEAHIWRPELEMGTASTCTPESLAEELFSQIDTRVKSMPRLASIVLLGFSTGSLLARRVFCRAHGFDRDGDQEHEPASWASKIDRMVVLSGITRGWEFSSAAPAHVRFLAPLLLRGLVWLGGLKALGNRLGRRKGSTERSAKPLILHLQRGAPFVVEARIQYVNALRMLRREAASGGQPELSAERDALRQDGVPSTIFLLGAKDEYISPADCTELGPRAEFVFLELPESNHTQAIRITGSDDVSRTRRERLQEALSEPYERLATSPWAVRSTDIDDYLDPMDLADGGDAGAAASERVKHAVMIVHGIRDHGFWTKRVAREVKRLGRELGVEVRAPTPSYGYFSMWDFVLPGGRERAAYWFLERYADVRAHFPDAKVSFVGHSNGTYIAARALELSPAVRFEYIVFAGSVVRRGFDWASCRGRFKKVCNYVGSNDRVVAFLPAVFEEMKLAWLDVGGAGAFGFDQARGAKSERSGMGEESKVADIFRAIGRFLRRILPNWASRSITLPKCDELHEVRYVQGGHGAAIDESFWPEVARFAIAGELPDGQPFARPAWLQALFGLAPFFTTLGIAAVATILLLPILVPAFLFVEPRAATWPRSIMVAAVIGGLALSWVMQRFLRQW